MNPAFFCVFTGGEMERSDWLLGRRERERAIKVRSATEARDVEEGAE